MSLVLNLAFDLDQYNTDKANYQTVRPSISFALIQELIHRDGLRVSLSGRDDVALEPILTFLLKHITDPRFGEMASQVAGVVIGAYLFTYFPYPSLVSSSHPRFKSIPLVPRSDDRHGRTNNPDLYTPVLGQSPLLDEMMEKLQSRIDRELRFQQDLMKLRGALDMTLAQVRRFTSSTGNGCRVPPGEQSRADE